MNPTELVENLAKEYYEIERQVAADQKRWSMILGMEFSEIREGYHSFRVETMRRFSLAHPGIEWRENEIPNFHDAQDRVENGTASALDILIYSNEPAGEPEASEFRQQVKAALTSRPSLPEESKTVTFWLTNVLRSGLSDEKLRQLAKQIGERGGLKFGLPSDEEIRKIADQWWAKHPNTMANHNDLEDFANYLLKSLLLDPRPESGETKLLTKGTKT